MDYGKFDSSKMRPISPAEMDAILCAHATGTVTITMMVKEITEENAHLVWPHLVEPN